MKQPINLDYLVSLNPCEARLDAYKSQYKNFNGTFSEFLDLKKVSYDDKIWVAMRYLNINQLVHFAILCADSVLPIFEAKYPENKSVIKLLNYMKKIEDFSIISSDQKHDIQVLRRSVAYAYITAASDAAYAAIYAAAAYAAYAAIYAADAVAAAASTVTAYATDASTVAAAKYEQQELNLIYLKMVDTL